MAQYTIESVGPTREWSGSYGPMLDYAVKFKEEPEWVSVSQKPDTPAPKEGDTLEGTIETTQYGKKFKKQSTGFGGGRGGGGFTSTLSVASQIVTSDKNPTKYTTLEDLVKDVKKAETLLKDPPTLTPVAEKEDPVAKELEENPDSDPFAGL